MSIDWKIVSASPGYISLKAAYICDVEKAGTERNPMRRKAEFLKKFNWVIARAKHYAHNTSKPIEEILDIWEEKRDHWWLNFYQESHQPKFGNRKYLYSVKREIKRTKKNYGHFTDGKRRVQMRILQLINGSQEPFTRDGRKSRWSTDRKKREARQREYRKTSSVS